MEKIRKEEDLEGAGGDEASREHRRRTRESKRSFGKQKRSFGRIIIQRQWTYPAT